MTRQMILWLAKREINKLSLTHQSGDEAKAISDEILSIFVSGTESSLNQLTLEETLKREQALGWHRRFFFWEGYAFGLAGMAALRLSKPNPDSLKLIPHYRSMHYTGFGFWNGLMGGIPCMALSESPKFWDSVEDADKLWPLYWGGAAFSEVVFTGSLGSKTIKRAKKIAGAKGTLGAFHGVGRALWWQYMNNAQGLEADLSLEGDDLLTVIEGVGLAIGFVNILEPKKIMHWIEQFDPSLHTALLGGVGVTMQAIVEEHPEHAARFEQIENPRLLKVHKVAALSSAETPIGPDWYSQCVDRIRSELA